MESKQFKITIDAPREIVWNVLWDDVTYRQWTYYFNPDSRAETDWKKGSKVLFLGKEDTGMVSTIADNIPNEFMSIKHLGIVKDGVEDIQSAESQQWAGSMENYTLQTLNGKTALTVDLMGADIPKDMQDYFMNAWPKALAKLKELAEKN